VSDADIAAYFGACPVCGGLPTKRRTNPTTRPMISAARSTIASARSASASLRVARDA
jgi:hypothetical protein